MSGTSTLISYSGKISRAELAQIQTPPATPSHIPIQHAEVVTSLVETLSLRHIRIVGEEFAVSGDGMEMFGVVDLHAVDADRLIGGKGDPHRANRSVSSLLFRETGVSKPDRTFRVLTR